MRRRAMLMNATIYPNDFVSSYKFRGLFNSVEDCPGPKPGDIITSDSGIYAYTGSCWDEIQSLAVVDNSVTTCCSATMYQPEQKMIPVSTCRYCGAPVNNDGECEYCGIKHQYIFN